MAREAFLKLEPSETAVVHAASRIYAAYLTAGLVDETNEDRMLKKAVQTATRIALMTDKIIQSDTESSGLR
jgi:hypothetical protein